MGVNKPITEEEKRERLRLRNLEHHRKWLQKLRQNPEKYAATRRRWRDNYYGKDGCRTEKYQHLVDKANQQIKAKRADPELRKAECERQRQRRVSRMAIDPHYGEYQRLYINAWAKERKAEQQNTTAPPAE